MTTEIELLPLPDTHTRWGLDAALMHVGRICYEQGIKDEKERKDMEHDCAAPTSAEVPMPEPVAYLYTLEYGGTIVNTKLSVHQLNYPFGVCGADYLARSDDGVSYVRQTPLYTASCRAAVEAAGYARGLAEAERDAERYRWLRRHFAIVGTDNGAVFHALNLPTPTHIAPDAAIELDASIDAALREEAKP